MSTSRTSRIIAASISLVTLIRAEGSSPRQSVSKSSPLIRIAVECPSSKRSRKKIKIP